MAISEQAVKIKMLLESGQYIKAMDEITGKTKNGGERMQKVMKGVGIAIGATVAALTKMAIEAGKTADHLFDLEQITGLSTDTLQEFQHVATVAGVDFDGLVQSMTRFTAKVSEADNESSSTSKALKQLGLSIRDANGNLKSADELFPEAIEKLQGMENVTQRNAIAQDIFGRALNDLAPVLGLTNEEFKGLREEAHKLGLVVDREALQAADNLRQKIDVMRKQFQVMGTYLGTGFADGLQTMVNGLTTSEDQMRSLNRVGSAIGKTISAIAQVVLIVTNAFSGFGEELKLTIDKIREFNRLRNEKRNGTTFGQAQKDYERLTKQLKELNIAENNRLKVVQEAMRKNKQATEEQISDISRTDSQYQKLYNQRIAVQEKIIKLEDDWGDRFEQTKDKEDDIIIVRHKSAELIQQNLETLKNIFKESDKIAESEKRRPPVIERVNSGKQKELKIQSSISAEVGAQISKQEQFEIVMQSIADVMQDMPGLAGKFADALGASEYTSQQLQASLSGVSGIVSQIASGNWIGAIISGLSSILDLIINSRKEAERLNKETQNAFSIARTQLSEALQDQIAYYEHLENIGKAETLENQLKTYEIMLSTAKQLKLTQDDIWTLEEKIYSIRQDIEESRAQALETETAITEEIQEQLDLSDRLKQLREAALFDEENIFQIQQAQTSLQNAGYSALDIADILSGVGVTQQLNQNKSTTVNGGINITINEASLNNLDLMVARNIANLLGG